MNTLLLDDKFARIGARLKIADRPSRRRRLLGVIALDLQGWHRVLMNREGQSKAMRNVAFLD
jgi:hypothetical protein